MNPYKHRAITELLAEMFNHFPVVVVSGARQTGKSRLLDEVFGEKADHVTFDPQLGY